MKKLFEATYGHQIQVENKWFGEKLYIDGELQDENTVLWVNTFLIDLVV